MYDQTWTKDSQRSVVFCFPVEVVHLLTSPVQTVSNDASPLLAAGITWILKLSGFPLFHIRFFVSSSFVTVSEPALNQPTQSDCLDFVLCILFSYTPLFLLLLKGCSTKINFFCLWRCRSRLFVFLQIVCLAFSTRCRCIKIISCDLFNTGTDSP